MMTFYMFAQAVAPFTLLCLFYFFYKQKKLEKMFLLEHKRNQQIFDLLTKSIEDLQSGLPAQNGQDEPEVQKETENKEAQAV